MMKTVAAPLALRVAPDRLLWRIALVLAGSALVALGAQLRVPLPGIPVPVTGQTFAVLLVGASLGSRLGLLSLLAYLAEGLAGVPVFAGGVSAWTPGIGASIGLPWILGTSAGYLYSFPIAAFVVGFLAERGWDRYVWTAALAMLVGTVVIYIGGVAWLARFFPADKLMAFGVTPFIPGDLYKLVAAALALPAARRLARPR